MKRPTMALCYQGAWCESVDRLLPMLDAVGWKATFAIDPVLLMDRLPLWREILGQGHEIINGTLSTAADHQGNFPLWTSDMIAAEVEAAQETFADLLRIAPSAASLPGGAAELQDGSSAADAVARVVPYVVMGQGSSARPLGSGWGLPAVHLNPSGATSPLKQFWQTQDDPPIVCFGGISLSLNTQERDVHLKFLEGLAKDGIAPLSLQAVSEHFRVAHRAGAASAGIYLAPD